MIRLDSSRLSMLKLALVCWQVVLWHRVVSGQDNKPTGLQGVVLDESGEALPGARVDISTAAPKSGRPIFCPSCYLDCQKWARTDESGRFEINDLDPGLKFRLVVSAAGYRTMQSESIAPDGVSLEFKLAERPESIDYQRVVRGVIRNEQGIPVSGASVIPAALIGPAGSRRSDVSDTSPAVSDPDGHFEIDLMDGTEGIDVEVFAEGLCGKKITGLVPGNERKEVTLTEGFNIVGSVEGHGNPINGMTIAVAQIDRRVGGEYFFLKAVPTVTDFQGQFELKYLPPDQEYCIYSVTGEANRSGAPLVITTHTFHAPSSGKTLDIGRLEAAQPISFGGRLTLPDGTAPTEQVTLLLNREPAWDLIKVPVEPDGSFCVLGLPAEVYEIQLVCQLYELDTDRLESLLWTEKSTKLLITKSTRDFVLPVRPITASIPDLEPIGSQTLKGRVIDAGGKGLSGIMMDATESVESLGKGLNDSVKPSTTSSGNGDFAMSQLPDMRVRLKLYRPDKDRRRFWYLGMVQPKQGAQDVVVALGREHLFQLDTIAGRIK